MVSFVLAASAIMSLSRRSLSTHALEPLRRGIAQHTLARSQTHGSILLISCGTQSTLVQYLLGRTSITMTLDRYSHWIPVHGKAHGRGFGIESTADKAPDTNIWDFSFLQILQVKERADERTGTAYPCSSYEFASGRSSLFYGVRK
jgi:hypothetical protein